MQEEKQFIPIWIKDARREGARTSGDVPAPARGVPKRPRTQKREKRTKREEAFICEGARLGSFRARCYNICLFIS